MKFNAFVQIFSFGVVSIIVYGATRALVNINAIDKGLADGMVICACLPMTISSVIVFTKLSGGDEASAIFNSAFGSLISVLLSPTLIYLYGVGTSRNYNSSNSNSNDEASIGDDGIDVAEVFLRLTVRIVIPIGIGQLLQRYSQWAVDFSSKYKPLFLRAQLYAVVFIVYVSCVTIYRGKPHRCTTANYWRMSLRGLTQIHCPPNLPSLITFQVHRLLFNI